VHEVRVPISHHHDLASDIVSVAAHDGPGSLVLQVGYTTRRDSYSGDQRISGCPYSGGAVSMIWEMRRWRRADDAFSARYERMDYSIQVRSFEVQNN
jgi:hypothetical protein